MSIRQRVWEGHIPLQINLSPTECRTYDQADPYLISFPRLSYLPFLVPRLLAFFSSSLIEPNTEAHQGWFSFEGVPLKWHYPVGLLYDLYAGAEAVTSQSGGGEYSSSYSKRNEQEQGQEQEREKKMGMGEDHPPLPWRLTLHFTEWPGEELVRLDGEGRVLHDAFINSVKEADFLRNGTGKGIMTLSKDDSSGLWESVQDHNFANYQRINNILLSSPSTPFRNIPLRAFLPSPPDATNPSLKIIQTPIPPVVPAAAMSPGMQQGRQSNRQTQTIGSALNSSLPSLFPSRRIPVLAKPVLHGAVLPMNTPVEEVARCAAYADGWVNVVVAMVG